MIKNIINYLGFKASNKSVTITDHKKFDFGANEMKQQQHVYKMTVSTKRNINKASQSMSILYIAVPRYLPTTWQFCRSPVACGLHYFENSAKGNDHRRMARANKKTNFDRKTDHLK